MKKTSLLALLLVLTMMMSGCALVTVDKVADNAQIIVDVNGETVTKQQVKNAVNNTIAQNEYMNNLYSSFGISASYPTDEATITPQVISTFVENLVKSQKAKELGLDQMTEEETAHIQENAEEDWQTYLSQVAQAYLSDSELEGDALTEEAKKYVQEHNLATLENFVDSATEEELMEKLEAYAKKDVTVTEEELSAELAERVAADEKNFTENADAFGTAYNNGTETYYAPAGYRIVKHILVKLTDEDSKAIEEKTTALDDAKTALEGAEEGADTAALQSAVDEAQKAVDEATEAAFANIQEKANEVYEKATAEGADFEALITEYSEDTMPASGYAVREGFAAFVAPFTEGAMALANVGDVSEPIRSDYGFHIIKYMSDVTEGAVTLDDVRDALQSEVLEEKQEEAYNAAVDAWIESANVKTYNEKMN